MSNSESSEQAHRGQWRPLSISFDAATERLARLDMMFTTLRVSTAVALLKSQRQLTLRCKIVQRGLYQRLCLRRFGKRFILGPPINCGCVGWPYRRHFQMDPYWCRGWSAFAVRGPEQRDAG